MKRITLSMLMLVPAALAAAQNPPTPPARPVPAARPSAAPPAPFFIPQDLDREAAREAAAFARAANLAAAQADRQFAATARQLDRESALMAREFARQSAELARTPLRGIPLPSADRFERRVPAPSWAPADPADSLYRLARDVVSRGDWGRAARLFADIQRSYPKSVYEKDAQYWEAFARYKIGTTDELHQAARILEPLASRLTPIDDSNRRYVFANNGRTSDNDILSLYARINGQLAQRGDADAAAKIAKTASNQGAPCDQEDMQVRTEALSALAQTDPAQALPLLKRVLDHRDECSASLRRNAVLILGRRADADAAALLLQTAKNDPNVSVRTEAVSYLSRVPGDAGVSALEDMLRTEQDERVQSAAVRALMASDNPKARASMRTLIDRKDAQLRLRLDAISSFRSDRMTADDAAYLRGLFGRAESDQLKYAIIGALARTGGPENDQWLMSIARNANESGPVRSTALSQLSRSPTLTTADLAKMYDSSSESYDMRIRIINLLSQRKDQESTDKLLEIAKSTTTVIDYRKAAINALMNRKDPRATQLLLDIIDGKKGEGR